MLPTQTDKAGDAAATVETRPEGITDAHLEFLDDLRESGVTNMFGAASYLDDEFPELDAGDVRSYNSSKKARNILSYWMKSFGKAGR